MKKILAVFDSYHFSDGMFDFLRKLHESEQIQLNAVFLPQSAFASVFSYAASANAVGSTGYFPSVDKEEAEKIKAQRKKFEELCTANSIPFRVHEDRINLTLPDLRLESRFADLMVLGGESFFANIKPEKRISYLRDAVRAAECPSLIIPEKYIFPNSLTVAYDGSEESVYALKQFAYIFPNMAKMPSLFLFAGEDKYQKDLPFRDYLTELATQHYKDLTLQVAEADPSKFFRMWMDERKGSLLICGAMHRSDISQFFKKSFVKDIIKDHHIPVFIAHRG